MARLRKAPALQAQTQPTVTTTRRALQEKTNTITRVTAPRYEDDGNTEGMITDAKFRRGRPKKQTRQDSDDMLMAGAIGPSDEQAPASDMPTITDNLAKSDTAPLPAAKGNRRPPRTVRKVTQNEAQAKVLEGLTQRMKATAQGQRAKATAAMVPSDTVAPSSESLPSTLHTRKSSTRKSREVVVERSEFSMSPSPPPSGKPSAVQEKRSSLAQPSSVPRVQGTPAVETSISALKNFKRRPRQPSMLAMVQQRTASVRSSAVHNVLPGEDSSIYDLDLDDEDDFSPEAEGTPFNAAKKKRKSSASTRTSVKRRKSALDEIQNNTGGDSFFTAEDIAAGSPSEQAETPQPAVTSDDLRTAREPSSSTPPTEPSSTLGTRRSHSEEVIVSSTEKERSARGQSVMVPSTEPARTSESREGGNGVDIDESAFGAPNGTMAEPASSSPVPESPTSTQADPVMQVSPAHVRPKPKKQKPVSTATLQSLLPKRRKALKPRRRKSEYDMESDSEADEDIVLDVSHLEDDEDELGGESRRRVASKARGVSTLKKARASKAPVSTVRQFTVAGSRKASVPPVSKGGKKTYGRGTISDKENDEAFESLDEAEDSFLPDVSISMHDAASGKELEEAKRKFAEVDDWDMEFESMSQDENRRSSQGWR